MTRTEGEKRWRDEEEDEGDLVIGDPALGRVHAPLRLICIMFPLASLKMIRGAGNILPGNTCDSIYPSVPSSFPLPLFHHHLPSSLLIPPILPLSDLPSLCVSKTHKRDKGNIWQSATLSTSHPSYINASLPSPPSLSCHPPTHLLVYVLPPFLSPPGYPCSLWAKARLHIMTSLAKYTSFQEEMNGFHLYPCFALPLPLIRLNIEWHRLGRHC